MLALPWEVAFRILATSALRSAVSSVSCAVFWFDATRLSFSWIKKAASTVTLPETFDEGISSEELFVSRTSGRGEEDCPLFREGSGPSWTVVDLTAALFLEAEGDLSMMADAPFLEAGVLGMMLL